MAQVAKKGSDTRDKFTDTQIEEFKHAFSLFDKVIQIVLNYHLASQLKEP